MADAWRERAACRAAGVDPLWFFPERGQMTEMRRAKAVCAGCPVRTECLEYAIPDPELLGIFGGTTKEDRRRLRVARRAA